MAANHINERLAQERRARLQAEQLLALRSQELYDAHRKLSRHANALSSQVIETREENEILKGQTTQTKAKLEMATKRAATAQRRLWDALTASEDGFAIFDRDWRLVAANPAFFEVFDGAADIAEGASYETILRVAVEEGIVDLQDEEAADWIDRMIARWEMTPIPRVDVKLWNGAFIRLNDKQTPQGDFVSVAVDITPNIRREKIMRKARDKAMAASRAKSNFLANMSHEIRTPMNGVVSMADLLRETDLDEDQRMYADTIRNSGEALLVIINDVLDYSKIEAGKMELHESSFDLNATVGEIFHLMRPAMENKDIALKLDYDIFLPSKIVADRGRVRQVLTNLIGNAVKFTEEGSVKVQITALPLGDEDLTLQIVVQDTGIGIPEDKQAHIFGEFNQVEGEHNRRHDGTGLGLAISRRLVEIMGGSMWLESQFGEGSAFVFTLPVKADPQAEVTPVAGLPVEQARVLLVGGEPPKESALMDALGRIHAATSLVRRLPDVRDLQGTQAVVLCGMLVAAEDLSKQLDALGFTGARLIFDEARDGYVPWVASDGLSDLREKILTPAEVTREPEAPPRRKRLLAAEDNKTNQLVFRTMLKSLNVDIVMTDNGLELVEAFKSDRPDIVMTDISMPQMDGLEAARQIRAHEAETGLPRCDIIAMTAHALEGDRERILAAGLDDYIAKPLKKAVLFDKISAALGNDVLPK